MATVAVAETADTKVAERTGDRRGMATVRRWLIIVAGAIALASGQAIASGLFFAFRGASSFTGGVAELLGCTVALICIPSIVIAIVATLSGRPLWQRVILFVPAFALQAAGYVACWCHGNSTDRAFAFLWLCPLLIVTAALPTFLLRLWRGWVLVPTSGDDRCRKSTIASLLWITTIWAAAAACTQRVDTHAWFATEAEPDRISELLGLIVVLSLPALLVGTALLLVLRTVMIERVKWAVLAVIAVSASFTAITVSGFVWCAWMEYRNGDQPATTDDLVNAAAGMASFCSTTLAIGSVCFVMIRVIGCRFLHGRSVLKSV